MLCILHTSKLGNQKHSKRDLESCLQMYLFWLLTEGKVEANTLT